MGSNTEPFDYSQISILDDVLTLRATDEDQVPLIAYPKSNHDVTDFELFNALNLDRFVDQASKYYIRHELLPNERKVVALSGPSNLDYVVSIFSLSRLGYTVLLLSPRLAPNAILSLLRETKCNIIVHPDSSQLLATIAQVQVEHNLKTIPMAQRTVYNNRTDTSPYFIRLVNKEVEKCQIAMICHSSGSTGLPKPIYQPHSRLIAPLPRGAGQSDFSCFPWFHSWGNKVCINSMLLRKTMYLWNSSQPVTADGLTRALIAVKPTVLHVVPYVIKILSEKEEGIEAMRACAQVVFTGSQCPQKLGDELVARGVNLCTLFGATEFSMFGTSMNRPPGDNAWDYIQVLPDKQPFVKMKPLGDNTYESVFLKELPTLVVSNSDDPPGSFHSRDIFSPHATISGAWKYLGRLDDRITLVNGEKVLPIPMEGRIRQEPLVAETIIFGIEKSVPGLLVIRSNSARGLNDQQFINAIWPAIEDANSQAEAFSQISREMVIPLPSGTEFPSTDKGTFIRAKTYHQFADIIEEAYASFEESTSGTLELEVPELEEYLMRKFTDIFGLGLSSPKTDFFAAGMDSLQAIQARRLIMKDLSVGGNVSKVGLNIVYESGNVANLARRLFAIRTGTDSLEESQDIFDIMQASIAKNSDFSSHVPSSNSTPDRYFVVLTGATGSLGAHLLAHLLSQQSIQKIYCLVRGTNALQRIKSSLHKFGLSSFAENPRIVALTSDLSKPDLSRETSILNEIKEKTTHIIHAAWTVNFNLTFQAFEDNIKSVHNLIQLSLSTPTPKPARFIFCSSISVALGTQKRPALIPEGPVEITQCSPGGYGRSKFVAESITLNAIEKFGADACILRIGQVVGDSKYGIWNEKEAIPSMIRSALELKMLPELNMECSWLPVDILASIILELSFPCSKIKQEHETKISQQDVYNLQSPHTFSWTKDLFPTLQTSGLKFIPVTFPIWIQKLTESERRNTKGDHDVIVRNPAVKLIEYFERAFGDGKDMVGDGITFDIGGAVRDSVALKEAPRLVEEGYIRRFLDTWMVAWGEGRDI